MSSRSCRRAASSALALAFTAASLAAFGGCTDGTTADCSDAAAGCSPDVDGTVEAASGGEGGPIPDATAVDAPVADSPVDTGGDAPSDGARAPDADGGLLDAKDG